MAFKFNPITGSPEARPSTAGAETFSAIFEDAIPIKNALGVSVFIPGVSTLINPETPRTPTAIIPPYGYGGSYGYGYGYKQDLVGELPTIYKYFSNTVDTDPLNLANWFEDADLLIPSLKLPNFESTGDIDNIVIPAGVTMDISPTSTLINFYIKGKSENRGIIYVNEGARLFFRDDFKNYNEIFELGFTAIDDSRIIFLQGIPRNMAGGYIEGNVMFYRGSNQGEIVGSARFFESGINLGIVEGIAVFNGGGARNGGILNGPAYFYGFSSSGIPAGDYRPTLNGPTYFYDNSYINNLGGSISGTLINHDIYMYGNSLNAGGIATFPNKVYLFESARSTSVYTSNDLVVFPEPKYFKNAADTDPNNPANWFSDEMGTIPLGRLPTAEENIIIDWSQTAEVTGPDGFTIPWRYSINRGTITANKVFFKNGSYNIGTVVVTSESANFSEDSYNHHQGVITRGSNNTSTYLSLFSGTSKNEGNLTDAFFSGNSAHLYGNLSGITEFVDNSELSLININNIVTEITAGHLVFRNNSQINNNGKITATSAVFHEATANRGYLVATGLIPSDGLVYGKNFSINFKGSSRNLGTTVGKILFSDSATNYANMLSEGNEDYYAVFTGTSKSWAGMHDLKEYFFYDYAVNMSLNINNVGENKVVNFYGNSQNVSLAVPAASVTINFYDYSINSGTVDAPGKNVNFYAYSRNGNSVIGNGEVNVYETQSGSWRGNPKFYGVSILRGNITGNPEFYDNSRFISTIVGNNATDRTNWVKITGKPKFYNNSRCEGYVVGTADFYNNSTNISTAIDNNWAPVEGRAIFHDTATNWGYIEGTAVFDGTSDYIGGAGYFGCAHKGNIIKGRAFFFNNSAFSTRGDTVDSAKIEGTAYFKEDSSIHYGTVKGKIYYIGRTGIQPGDFQGPTMETGGPYGDGVFTVEAPLIDTFLEGAPGFDVSGKTFILLTTPEDTVENGLITKRTYYRAGTDESLFYESKYNRFAITIETDINYYGSFVILKFVAPASGLIPVTGWTRVPYISYQAWVEDELATAGYPAMGDQISFITGPDITTIQNNPLPETQYFYGVYNDNTSDNRNWFNDQDLAKNWHRISASAIGVSEGATLTYATGADGALFNFNGFKNYGTFLITGPYEMEFNGGLNYGLIYGENFANNATFIDFVNSGVVRMRNIIFKGTSKNISLAITNENVPFITGNHTDPNFIKQNYNRGVLINHSSGLTSFEDDSENGGVAIGRTEFRNNARNSFSSPNKTQREVKFRGVVRNPEMTEYYSPSYMSTKFYDNAINDGGVIETGYDQQGSVIYNKYLHRYEEYMTNCFYEITGKSQLYTGWTTLYSNMPAATQTSPDQTINMGGSEYVLYTGSGGNLDNKLVIDFNVGGFVITQSNGKKYFHNFQSTIPLTGWINLEDLTDTLTLIPASGIDAVLRPRYYFIPVGALEGIWSSLSNWHFDEAGTIKIPIDLPLTSQFTLKTQHRMILPWGGYTFDRVRILGTMQNVPYTVNFYNSYIAGQIYKPSSVSQQINLYDSVVSGTIRNVDVLTFNTTGELNNSLDLWRGNIAGKVIANNVKFYGTSVNFKQYDDIYNGPNQKIDSPLVEFFDDSVNAGEINGNVNFYNNSKNSLLWIYYGFKRTTPGVINGNAIFNDNSMPSVKYNDNISNRLQLSAGSVNGIISIPRWDNLPFTVPISISNVSGYITLTPHTKAKYTGAFLGNIGNDPKVIYKRNKNHVELFHGTNSFWWNRIFNYINLNKELGVFEMKLGNGEHVFADVAESLPTTWYRINNNNINYDISGNFSTETTTIQPPPTGLLLNFRSGIYNLYDGGENEELDLPPTSGSGNNNFSGLFVGSQLAFGADTDHENTLTYNGTNNSSFVLTGMSNAVLFPESTLGWTIEFYYKNGKAVGLQPIFNIGDEEATRTLFGLSVNNSMLVVRTGSNINFAAVNDVANCSTGVNQLDSTIAFLDVGVWKHVAVVYFDGTLTFYIDGAAAANFAWSSFPVTCYPNTIFDNVGKYRDQRIWFPQGKVIGVSGEEPLWPTADIDCFRITNEVLYNGNFTPALARDIEN